MLDPKAVIPEFSSLNTHDTFIVFKTVNKIVLETFQFRVVVKCQMFLYTEGRGWYHSVANNCIYLIALYFVQDCPAHTVNCSSAYQTRKPIIARTLYILCHVKTHTNNTYRLYTVNSSVFYGTTSSVQSI